MKLKQFNDFTLVSFEMNNSSLEVTKQKILRREKEEYLLKDILITDTYALKYHHKSALGGVIFFGGLFVHSAFEPILNPGTSWFTTDVFGALALLFIIRFFVPTLRIFIPTKDQGLIRLYMNKPSKRKVREFMYALEGNVQLVNKISLAKSKYPYVI